jgi:signal transduction histidine kinase/ActR/RegA family two-component response regulator
MAPSLPLRAGAVPLRTILILAFVAQVAVATGITGWLSIRDGQRAVNEVATRLREEISRRVHGRLGRMLRAPGAITRLCVRGVELGLLDPADQEGLQLEFARLLSADDQINVIYFGTAQGAYVDVSRDGGTTFTAGPQAGPLIDDVLDAHGRRTGPGIHRPEPYDPRLRPWYRNAVTAEGPRWSGPFSYFDGEDMVLASVLALRNAEGEVIGVFAADLALDTFAEFLRRLQVGRSGLVYLVDRAGTIWTSSAPAAEAAASAAHFPAKASDSSIPLIRATARAMAALAETTGGRVAGGWSFRDAEGRNHLVDVKPYQDVAGLDLDIVTVIPESDFMDRIAANTRRTLWLCGAALLLAIGIGLWAARRVTQPIMQLARAAPEIAHGRWRQDLPTERSDEVGVLARAVRDMAQQLEASFATLENQVDLRQRLLQAEKMQAIGQLAGGIAHDFNNMLAPIIGFSESIAATTEGVTRERARNISAAANRCAELNAQLLAFARKEQPRTIVLDPGELVRAVVKLLQRTVAHSVRVETALPDRVPAIRGDPAQLQSALLNLGINARDAMPGGGTVRYALDCVVLDQPFRGRSSLRIPPGRYVRVLVGDEGHGIPPEILSSIFEPFFTTKPIGRGTGIGLASVYGTIELHGGSIDVVSTPGVGTTFTLYLPVSEEAPVADPGAVAVPSGESLRILIVDDEPMVGEVMVDLLGDLGHTVTLCASGQQAIDHYATHARDIDLVLLDLNMPGLDGVQTLAALRVQDPALRAFIITGYARDDQVTPELKASVLGFLPKPFRHQDLVAALAKIDRRRA